MTTGVLRYGIHDSVAVIDESKAGQTANEVIGFGGDVPVVASLEDAMKFKPEALLVGITPTGGRLPDDLKNMILDAIDKGLDCWAGLHDFMSEDPDIADAANRNGVEIWDLRKPGKNLPVGGGLCRWSDNYIALMVGTDAAIGKMTVACEMNRDMNMRGINSEFVATGQVGIAIAGWGSPIDAIPGDFMAGCVERDVMACKDVDVVLVEGQGSLYHPGFSSVTLALIHGSCPDGIILCHQSTRKEVSKIKDIPIPPLNEVADLYLHQVKHLKPDAKIIGVSINSSGTSEEEIQAEIKEVEALLGVPATDPVRFGTKKLIDAVEAHRKEVGK